MAVAKIKEQLHAKLLRSQGKSLNEIVKELNVAKSSVSIWVRDVPLSRTIRHELLSRGGETTAVQWRSYWEKYPRPVKGPRWPKRKSDHFFDTWTPEMAYVLGYFAADGTMFRNPRGSHYVGFCSTDIELIKNVKHLMGVTNNVETKQPAGNRKRLYTLQIGSKRLFEQLLTLGFIPNKSLKLQMPAVPEKMFANFVRGYFDGDGCVNFGVFKRKSRSSSVATLSTQFICGSKPFLVSLHKILKKLVSISGGAIHYHDGAHRLVYSTKGSRQLYRFMYPTTTVPCLKRKRDVFENSFGYWT